MARSITLPLPDYEADDVLVVTEREQLRALADDLRAKLVALLRERARSTTDLAAELELPKGTVGHHLKVLERAGLVRVVRTRKVRALTERYYGRVARLFVLRSTDAPLETTVASIDLRQAADEIRLLPGGDTSTFAFLHVRLTEADARRLRRRLDRLAEDFRARETPEGQPFGLAAALYRMDRDE